MCTHTHHEREARSPLRPGSRSRLRALEAREVFYALSCYLNPIFKHSDTKWDAKNPPNVVEVLDALLCYLSPIFKHSDTKWDKKNKNKVGQNLGWGVPPVPPSKIRHCHVKLLLYKNVFTISRDFTYINMLFICICIYYSIHQLIMFQ